MTTERRIQLWALVLAQADGRAATLAHVCATLIGAAGVDAVAVAVTLTATPRETVYTSGRLADDMQDLALTLGEGPGVDAGGGGPFLVADLGTTASAARWPALAPAATAIGVYAVFALPLRIGAIRLGVMDLYRARPGPLDNDALTDALILADLACALLLDAARPGTAGQPPEQTLLHHPQVHQATGMIMVQLGVPAAVALVRLRAFAYAAGRGLRDVAGDVVVRRLRFEPEPEPEPEPEADTAPAP
jgi:hypothetical protein